MVDQTGFPNVSLDLIAGLFANNAPNPPQSLEFGTGTTPTLPSTTTLESPTGGGPHTIDSYARTGVGQSSIVVNLGLTEENGNAITEVGVYDGTSGDGVDTMYIRRTGEPLNKTANVIARIEVPITAEDRSIIS